MTTIADRLRAVMHGVPPVAVPVQAPAPTPPSGTSSVESRVLAEASSRSAVADTLGGAWHERKGQPFLVVDRDFASDHRHGRVAISEALPPASGAWPMLPLLGGAADGGGMLFVDLETTGLAGGAGTSAFLVGCAWFERDVFRIRQFFLASPVAERAMLETLTELTRQATTVVTYNGKSFDLPLIETRFLFHRLTTPFEGMPHVDMLHAARRLWRDTAVTPSREGGHEYAVGSLEESSRGACRLSVLEGTLCGHLRRGDVPGAEIPSRYFDYVRSGDARPLAAVLEHNRLDLLSLALVTAQAARLLDHGPASATTTREALGLGQLFERGGRVADARACYARAAGLDDAESLRACAAEAEAAARIEALRAYALLSRRARRYDDAARGWRGVLEVRTAPASIVREASEALAIHHEHRLRDPRTARTFAAASLRLPGSAAALQARQHRLARLERKLNARPLF